MFARAFARSARLTRPAMLRRGGGGGMPINEPGGVLFNDKGAAKEGWEDLYYWGMGGGFALMTVALIYKPDSSVMTWAKKEAEKSLKEKGVQLEYPKTN